jgi:hypothetical protein
MRLSDAGKRRGFITIIDLLLWFIKDDPSIARTDG